MTVADPLARHSKRLVRAVAREDGPHAMALYRLAMLDRTEWSLPDWQQTLKELDTCELTVEDYRSLIEVSHP